MTDEDTEGKQSTEGEPDGGAGAFSARKEAGGDAADETEVMETVKRKGSGDEGEEEDGPADDETDEEEDDGDGDEDEEEMDGDEATDEPDQDISSYDTWMGVLSSPSAHYFVRIVPSDEVGVVYLEDD